MSSALWDPCQAALSMAISSFRDFPNPGIEPGLNLSVKSACKNSQPLLVGVVISLSTDVCPAPAHSYSCRHYNTPPVNPLRNTVLSKSQCIKSRHWCPGKCLTTGSQEKERKKGKKESEERKRKKDENPSFVALASFHAVKTPTKAKFKLRTCRLGKRCTRSYVVLRHTTL